MMILSKDKIDKSWIDAGVGEILKSPAMQFIENELLTTSFNPEPHQVFRVFEMPLDKIKVVILGQEPYPVRANGLAFSTDSEPIPYSLRVIIDSLSLKVAHDITLGTETTPFDVTLNHWVKQGVFLLNKSLTCYKGQVGNSHLSVWSGFTDYIISIIAKRGNIVWLLLGETAKEAVPIIKAYKNNYIITDNHPAAVRYGKKFSGSCFNKVNEFLKDREINWIS